MLPKRCRKFPCRNMQVKSATSDGCAGRKPHWKTKRSYTEAWATSCWSTARSRTDSAMTRRYSCSAGSFDGGRSVLSGSVMNR